MSNGPDKRDLAPHRAWMLILTVCALGLFLALASACQETVGHVQGRPSLESPAKGSQVRHQYRYYPDSAVYMDTGRRLFFYRDGGKWLATTILPASVQVDWKNYVVLDLDTDKPYQRHSEIAKKYPPKSPHALSPGKAAP